MLKYHNLLGLCLTLAVLFLVSQPAIADLIYNMVDHEVAGHMLTGTITAEDTAPDDGILQNNEVIGWDVDVVHVFGDPPVDFTISSTDTGAFLDIANVLITPTEILIQDATDIVTVSSMQYGVLIPLVADLEYLDQNDLLAGGSATYRDDMLIVSRPLPDDLRVHATIVPEPGAFLLLGFAGMGLVGRRKSKTAKTN